MSKIIKILNDFDSVTLSEMEEVSLMDRVDTKFAFSIKEVEHIIAQLKSDYDVLDVDGQRISDYKSLYFDDEDFQFYNDHHNTKDNRFKVRYRTYVNSDTHFFEIKEKRKGRTTKTRIPVEKVEKELVGLHFEFLKNFIENPEKLEPKLWNEYKRITFVSKNKKERLTLDLNLRYEWEELERSFHGLVIAELKQKKLDRSSVFFKIMKASNIRPYRLSKYCLGALKIHKKSRLKYNRFKTKLLKLKRITDDN